MNAERDYSSKWLNDVPDEPVRTEQEEFELFREMRMEPGEFADEETRKRYVEWLRKNPLPE